MQIALQCQINVNLVFHIAEDNSEIDCVFSKASVKSSRT